MKKSFVAGETVEVQRDVGLPWERAKYGNPIPDMRGWHRVLLLGPARRIDSSTGIETSADNPRSFLTNVVSLPTQRIRSAVAPLESEPRITPEMVKRLKTALTRSWLVIPSISKEAHPIIDEWAKKENAR